MTYIIRMTAKKDINGFVNGNHLYLLCGKSIYFGRVYYTPSSHDATEYYDVDEAQDVIDGLCIYNTFLDFEILEIGTQTVVGTKPTTKDFTKKVIL